MSERATPGRWQQEFYRDGELLPDGTGGMDDYETPGSGVFVIDEASDEGYCLAEMNANNHHDAAFIVALVNAWRDGELVLRSEVEAAEAKHREEWASYIANWDGAVGPEPPTVQLIVETLRGPVPFGSAAGGSR